MSPPWKVRCVSSCRLTQDVPAWAAGTVGDVEGHVPVSDTAAILVYRKRVRTFREGGLRCRFAYIATNCGGDEDPPEDDPHSGKPCCAFSLFCEVGEPYMAQFKLRGRHPITDDDCETLWPLRWTARKKTKPKPKREGKHGTTAKRQG